MKLAALQQHGRDRQLRNELEESAAVAAHSALPSDSACNPVIVSIIRRLFLKKNPGTMLKLTDRELLQVVMLVVVVVVVVVVQWWCCR